MRTEIKHDVSPPLRDMAKTAPAPTGEEEAEDLPLIPLPRGFKPEDQPDAVQQTKFPAFPAVEAPVPGLNFEGLGSGFPNYFVNLAPPDTEGAVGLTQYVQWVNVSFAVFDKTTGDVIMGPVGGNTLWAGFGNECETSNDGDPIVTYDKLANRWIFTQFVVRSPGGTGFGPFFQCVAVSTSSDATGSYNRYIFPYDSFNDYPKMGVWPDAYYITFNLFNTSGTAFLGADACAYDRNAMLNGQAATQICFPQVAPLLGLLPSDVDGHSPPPDGSPNFVMSFGVNALELYKFHVDFTTPANSTFTGPTTIPVSPFSPLCGGLRGCVPQPPGDGTQLDSLADRLMYRLAYRNFGDHESLVVNHSVATTVNSTATSGVRWYEIRNPNGTPTVFQQSTFAPDTNFRWMGSVAMDVSGDLAVGYSVSSSTTFPSIAYAVRAFSDPLSMLQPETNVVSGTGSQVDGLTRWGDYSAMQVDPSDDCTFWYTDEYIAHTGFLNWNTRIASFKFPGCGVPDLSIGVNHSGNFTQGQTGATYTISVTNSGGKPTDGTTVTVTDTLPTGLNATAIDGGLNWTCTLGTLTCTRTDVLASGASYDPITVTVNVAANAPGSVTNSATVSGGGDKNPANNSTTDPTTVIQTGPDPAIMKTHSGPFIQGQTGVYTITVTNVGLSPTDGTTVTVSDTLPSGLTFNSVSATGWTCNAASPLTCTRKDALASNTAYPPITLTVNIANNASASVVNTATVAGGGDTNNLNNAASDTTFIIPPPADLTIAKSHTGNFNQGQNSATYTLTVSNIGGGPTVGKVTVADSLPTGLTAVFGSGNGWFCGVQTNTTLTCTRSDVLAAAGSYPPITFFVNVAGNAPASVTNTASVAGGGEVNTNNDTASDPTTINPAPDLTIAETHSPDPMIVGQTGTYTITVTNSGSAATSGVVTVTDFLPNGLTATAVSQGWSCGTLPTFFLSCTRSDALSAGSSYPALSVTVSVSGGGPSVTNSVSVSGGGEFNTANDSASDLTNITAPVLAITKTHAPDPFTVGQNGTYTITVSNVGKIATVGTVTMNDFLPQGMTATAISGAGWSCPALPTQFVNCSRSDSLATNTAYPALIVTVSVGNSNSTATNTANVTGGGDTTTRSASDTANILTPTLAITKTHVGNFIAGQDGVYEITVSNTGKVATTGIVTLQDFLPFGLTAVAAGGPGWNCSTVPTTFLTCTRSDSIATGASYPTLLLTVSVVNTGSTVTNTASVTGGGDALSHSASDTANVSGPTLSIKKSHTGNFTSGQNGSYAIVVGNVGAVATSGTVNLQDFLPFGLTATAVSGSGWSCPQLPATFLTCTRSDALSPGSSYPTLNVTVSVATSGTVTNTASVSGGGDGNSHSANDPTTINSGPVLSISKSHVGNFTVGQTGVYTITVGNTGALATSGAVTLQDFLPSGLTATAVSGTGWSCSTLPTTFLNCTRSDVLNAGSSYPALMVTVSVTGGAPSVVNNASVTGGGDSQSHNASDPTNINGPTLNITKSHTGDPFIVGQSGTYTITVDNKAGQAATSGTVTVQDFLPSGLSASTISGTGWSCTTPPASFVTCTRSDALAAGSSYPAISITVSVSGGGPSVTNTASVNGGGDSLFHSASDVTNITAPVLAITKTHSPDPFIAGQMGTYTITVSNKGTVATNGTVTVTDSLPSGLSLSSASGTGWGCSGTTFVSCTRSDILAAGASYPALVLSVNIANATATIINTASVSGGGDSQIHNATDTANVTTPLLSITKSHTGNFTAGQTGTYTINVGNVGSVATVGTVTVTDFLPFPLTATAFSGSGWGCSGVPTSFLTCTRSDALATNSSYPPLLITVSVGAGSSSVTNTASVTGGGDALTHNASDPTVIVGPTLAITKTHSGNFVVGQGGTYTLTVSNTSNISTSGNVNVQDSLPQGLTATAITASGWNCSFPPTSFVNCSRSDALAGGSSYSSISLTVSIDPTVVQSGVVNQATVSGGGDPLFHTATDPTSVSFPDLTIAMSHAGNFFPGENGATYTINVSNIGVIPTAGGTIVVADPLPIGLTATAASGTGWTCSIFNGAQTEMDCTRPAGTLTQGNSYPPITLTVNAASNAPALVTNTAFVFGIGETNFNNNVASDVTKIVEQADIPVSGDFDGDGKTDIAVWRPSTGTWWIIRSSDGAIQSRSWGVRGDIPVPGDYDGDGKTDLAIWRPSTGTWWIVRSSDGVLVSQPWGFAGDVPVPGDYDGDHKNDLAIWRPSTGTWWVLRSSDGAIMSQEWGFAGDMPVPGDYDGDHKTDFAIWRPSTGTWWVLRSSDGAVTSQEWGFAGDVPAPGDYDGDRKNDFAIWRPSTGTWWVLRSSDGAIMSQQWGLPGDLPVAGDFDNDHKKDFAVWRVSTATWFIIRSSDGVKITQQWGNSGGDAKKEQPIDNTVLGVDRMEPK